MVGSTKWWPHLGRVLEPSIDTNVALPVEPVMAEGELAELLHRVGFSLGIDELGGLVVLEYPPHCRGVVTEKRPSRLVPRLPR